VVLILRTEIQLQFGAQNFTKFKKFLKWKPDNLSMLKLWQLKFATISLNPFLITEKFVYLIEYINSDARFVQEYIIESIFEKYFC
jgi:hypothetical protein